MKDSATGKLADAGSWMCGLTGRNWQQQGSSSTESGTRSGARQRSVLEQQAGGRVMSQARVSNEASETSRVNKPGKDTDTDTQNQVKGRRADGHSALILSPVGL